MIQNAMQNDVCTFNEWHLGDNLIHLNYLYRLAKLNPEKKFRHYVNKNHLAQLNPLLEGIPNITLFELGLAPSLSTNCWIGHQKYFHNSPLKRDWVSFHLGYFKYLSNLLGFQNPVKSRDDLLFDFPVLGNCQANAAYDFLIINSTPLSSQIADFDSNYLTQLTAKLVDRGCKVVTTHPTGFTKSTLEQGYDLLKIAQLSNRCHTIIGVPNGPMWLTFNSVNNKQLKARLVWLSIQNLNLGVNCLTCENKEAITNILKESGVI